MRTVQRTAPTVPLNSHPHTYKSGFSTPSNNYVGKVGWGAERPDLAISPERHWIGASGGTGSAALISNTSPPNELMRNAFDQGRNHGFLGDRGAGNARETNSKLD